MQAMFFLGMFALLVAASQIALMSFFVVYRDIGFVLPALVLLVMSARPSSGLIFVFVTGLILDSYALAHWQLHSLRLMVVFTVTWLVFSRWLTNRSLYTAMVLALLATVIDRVCSLFIQLIQGVSLALAWSWSGFLLTLVLHVLFSVLGFSLLMSAPRRWLSWSRGSDPQRWYG